MSRTPLGGRPPRPALYGPTMNTQSTVAPRIATTDNGSNRREGRLHHLRRGAATGVIGIAVAFALGACSPGSSAPESISLTSVGALPSVDASAVASMAADAALTALDQVDAAITASQTSGALSASDATTLQQLTAGLRTSLQTGTPSAAQTAFGSLSTKVDEVAATLPADASTQLKAAIDSLKAALPAG